MEIDAESMLNENAMQAGGLSNRNLALAGQLGAVSKRNQALEAEIVILKAEIETLKGLTNGTS